MIGQSAHDLFFWSISEEAKVQPKYRPEVFMQLLKHAGVETNRRRNMQSRSRHNGSRTWSVSAEDTTVMRRCTYPCSPGIHRLSSSCRMWRQDRRNATRAHSHILAIDFTRVLRMISRVRCAYAFLRIRAIQEIRVKRYSTQGGKSLSTYGIFPTT
jgi:hypothetical protein